MSPMLLSTEYARWPPVVDDGNWPELPVRSRARQQSFGSIAGLPSGSAGQVPRTGSPGQKQPSSNAH